MENEEKTTIKESESSALAIKDDTKEMLANETTQIVHKVVKEANPDKIKDLTQLFNVNQTKKNIVRAAKLNDLLDTITDQALQRFSERPDEMSNKELLDGLKVVQDSLEKNQKQIDGVKDTPLIQINQQDITVKTGVEALDREARNRVANIVMGIINSSKTAVEPINEVEEAIDIIDQVDESVDSETEEDIIDLGE